MTHTDRRAIPLSQARTRDMGAEVLLAAALVALALLAAAMLYAWAPGLVSAPGEEIARASYAVGVSAGAGFRGVMPVSLADFRQGLVDGLGDEAAQVRVLSRPELFLEIRNVMRRLSDAELALVAARLDAEAEY
jgi:hypothetical protein